MTSPQFLRLALRPAPLPSGKIPVIGLKAAVCCACLAVALGITGCGSLAASIFWDAGSASLFSEADA